MKKILAVLIILAAAVFAFTGCSQGGEDVSVAIQAKTADSISRAVNAGDEVTTVDSYLVTFKKVEIGNSEDEKYTLWESAEGEEMDIVGGADFTDTLPVAAGTYNYLRFEVETVLDIAGSIDDNGTIYTGTGSCTLDGSTYLFGTDIENLSGELTVTEPITITDGTVLVFNFDVDGTVLYQSGPADAAVLTVEKPVITLGVE